MRMISVMLVSTVLGAVGLDTCGEESQCTQGLENDPGQKSVIKHGKAPIDDVNEVLDKSYLLQSKKVHISEEVEDGLSKLAQVASRDEDEIQQQVIEDKGQGSGSGTYKNAGSAVVQVSRHLASNVVNPGELLPCDDCILEFKSSGGCEKDVESACFDYLPEACTRKAVALCATANEGEDEGKGMVSLEQREVKDDQSERMKEKAGPAAAMMVRSTSTLGIKKASVGKELGKHMVAEVLGESVTNSITGALAQIPGIHTVPFIGDFLGLGPTQDMTVQDCHDKLSKELNDGFEKVNIQLGEIDNKLDDLGNEVGNLKTHMGTLISDQTAAITDMLTTSTTDIITEITANAKENLKAIQNFRQQAQRNHDSSMNMAREAMFDSHHRQCLEYMTSILAKYGLYELVLSSALEARQEFIDHKASEWIKHENKYCRTSDQLSFGSSSAAFGFEFRPDYTDVETAKTACLENSNCYGYYFNGHSYARGTTSIKLIDARRVSDAGDFPVSSVSYVMQKPDPRLDTILVVLKESEKLFNFLSHTGMGSVIDFQQLYVCTMPTQYTESLLAKFIRLRTNDKTTTFNSQMRKSALELASDVLDTGKMSYDMQDMQLMLVDHLGADSRAEFAIKVGMQLNAAFEQFRTTIHNAQEDLSFLDLNQWPNSIIIEYGHNDNNDQANQQLCPGGKGNTGGTPYGTGNHETFIRKSVFKDACKDAIEACIMSDDCNEALVFTEDQRTPQGFSVQWYTALLSEPKGFGCDPGSTMNVRNLKDQEDNSYGNGAFAAFYILQI